MSELDEERQHLVLADRHMREGGERIAQQTRLVSSLGHGPDRMMAQQLLDTLEATLVQWREHRVLILERIAVLEARES